MSVKLILEAIEKIAESFSGLSEVERVQAYATIKVLTDELIEYAKSHGLPHAYISEKIVELIDAARGLAHLIEDSAARDDSSYLREAYPALQKLRSSLCFNVQR